MKRNLFLSLSLFIACGLVQAQTVVTRISSVPISQSYYSLDEIPTKWSTSSRDGLEMSALHSKSGGKSLSWNAKDGDCLTVDSLGISTSQTYDLRQSSSAQIFIYSLAATNDTLIFKFVDTAGIVKREGHMLLNFTGWRDYHRNYRYDYNLGGELPGFNLKQCKIIYKPCIKGSSALIFFDEAKFISYDGVRCPGPHMLIDKDHFQKNGNLEGNVPLLNWLNEPDIAVTEATTTEIADLKKVANLYIISPSTPTAALVSAAKNYVASCHISINADGTINGRGISLIYDIDTLYVISKHVLNLIQAYKKLGDTNAKTQLILFTRYLLDQGLAEGGRTLMPTSSYAECREFPKGFIMALPEYPVDVRNEVIKMLKWSVEFNRIYSPNYISKINSDYYFNKGLFLFQLVFNSYNNDNTQVRDLKSLSRFMVTLATVGDGVRDGIKPDGLFYHHLGSNHNYAGSFGTWMSHVYKLANTIYRIDKPSYDTVAFFIKNMFLITSKGLLYPTSLAGRAIYPNFMINSSAFRQLVEIGGDILGNKSRMDPEMASIYRYIFDDTYYSNIPKVDFDGFYQYNYAQLGVLRHNNWIAGMRGFTDKNFGTEIFANENVYGRYTSYGAIEVIYNGDRSSSGTVESGSGWNWNVIPGTTTVHLPFTTLRPTSNGTRSEFQSNSYVGALSSRKEGVFAMDFLQDSRGYYTTSNLGFKKTVFAFDSLMICLGSGIKAKDTRGNVRTNLFQAINPTSNPSIYLNSTTATTSTITTTVTAGTGGYWIMNGQTTGFFIPGNSVNNSFTITRGTQTTPKSSSFDGSQTSTAKVSMAWIDHGLSPTGAKYQYVIVPGTTPQKMQSLSSSLSAGSVYQVLAQTDTLHAVKYLPTNSTSYAFFNSKSNVNIGRIQSLTGKALINIREIGDTLLLSLTNPDLNTIDYIVDYQTRWKSQPNTGSLTLIGGWKVIENAPASVISHGTNSITIDFQNFEGSKLEFKLVQENLNALSPQINSNIKITTLNGTIKLSGIDTGQNIEIYDVLGRKVISTVAKDRINTIDIKEKGVLFVKVGSAATKIVL